MDPDLLLLTWSSLALPPRCMVTGMTQLDRAAAQEGKVFAGLFYLVFRHSEGKLDFLNVFISRKRKQLLKSQHQHP